MSLSRRSASTATAAAPGLTDEDEAAALVPCASAEPWIASAPATATPTRTHPDLCARVKTPMIPESTILLIVLPLIRGSSVGRRCILQFESQTLRPRCDGTYARPVLRLCAARRPTQPCRRARRALFGQEERARHPLIALAKARQWCKKYRLPFLIDAPTSVNS